MHYTFLIQNRVELVEKVIRFFTAKTLDSEYFKQVQEYRKDQQLLQQQIPNFKACVALGHMTIMDFLMFESDYAQKSGIPTALVQDIVEAMRRAMILMDEPLLNAGGGHQIYVLNESLVKFLGERNCLTNVIFGFAYIADKYATSVFKIVVQDQRGDRHIGTGFLTSYREGEQEFAVIVTNKHVAEYHDGLRVLDLNNNHIPHSRIVLSGEKDLAAIEPANFLNLPSLYFYEQPTILDEIITIGFPNVAMAKDSYQVTHSGEINSLIVDHTGQDLLLFSAKTAPGNSGGPLINEMGLAIGVVTQDLFFKDALIERGQLPYHAAIPAAEVVKFLKTLAN